MESSSFNDHIDKAFISAPEHRSSRPFNLNYDEDIQKQIPVIDLSTEAGKERRDLISQIGQACEEWGFFQVVNHGIPSSVITNLKEAAMEFFGLPIEEKLRVKRTFENCVGYNDGELTKNIRDWKEVLDVAVADYFELPSDFHADDNKTLISTNQWPASMPKLRDACEEYISQALTLAFRILELISESLSLPADHFHEQFRCSHTSRLRLNHYSPCPAPELALGVGRHKDVGALTVLLQDEVGGLEVRRKDGEWIGVKPNSSALVINVGDMIQVYSNDKYKSVEHRVVVNDTFDRYSFPIFFNPAHWVNISPASALISDENPAKYRPFNWGKYIRSRMDSNFKNLGVENLQIYDFAIKQ